MKLWERAGYSLIKWSTILCMIFILCIIMISDSITYAGMNQFKYTQYSYFLIAIIVLLAAFFFGHRLMEKVKVDYRRVVLFFTILLFIMQTVINMSTHLLASWDISSAIIPAAKAIVAQDNTQQWFSTYYSRYGNNLLVCWVYSRLFMILNLFHCYDQGDSLSVIIFVNSIFACLSIYLVYHCTTKLAGEKWGLAAWICSMILIGGNPWFLITYTDAFSIWISVSIFCVVLCGEEYAFKRFYKYFLICILAYWGYHIKPQTCIVFIAFIIVKILYWTANFGKRERTSIFTVLVAVLSSIVLSSSMYAMVKTDFPFAIEKEAGFSWPHYIMMGLNNETDGKYLGSDVEYSSSFATKKERNAANAKVIVERMRKYGVKGYAQLIIKKTAICYTDGTFGYSDGAMHPEQQYDCGNKAIAALAGYFLYPYNEGFEVLENILQVLWIMILLGMIGLCFQKNLPDSIQYLLMLVLIGTFLFEMIFEVQPRHLYCNIPLYIISGTIGLKQIKQWVCPGVAINEKV